MDQHKAASRHPSIGFASLPGLALPGMLLLAALSALPNRGMTGDAMAASQPSLSSQAVSSVGETGHTPPPAALPARGQKTHPAPDPARDLADELARRDSATASLQNRCALPITARLLDRHAPPAMQDNARRMIQATRHTTLAIRHVLLACGNTTYSEAWNLYRPDRLTARTRHLLADGHTPFGRAVGEHNFQRVRLNSRLEALPPGIVLENHALLRRRSDGAVFACLIERYTHASLRQSPADPIPGTTAPPQH